MRARNPRLSHDSSLLIALYQRLRLMLNATSGGENWVQFMANSVAVLQVSEDPAFDMETLRVLRRYLGHEASQNVIERAVFEISERLGQIERAHLDGDQGAVGNLAKSLVSVSEQIGLRAVSSVARDVVFCARRAEPVALAAVTSRLIRIGDQSLYWAVEAP